jgi:hypothetical protein
MRKEKLSQIVDGVYKATVNGSLKWSLANSIFNSDTRHKYTSMSTDGVTKFNCEVTLKDDLTLSTTGCSLNISNPSMVDDGAYLYSDEYPVTKSIQRWIYDNHVQPGLKVANQDNVMDDILKGIDVSEYRDKKIETILDEKPIMKEEEPKKSLLKKLFGK